MLADWYIIHNKPKDVLLRDAYAVKDVSSSCFEPGEVKRVVEVALLCISSNKSDSMYCCFSQTKIEQKKYWPLKKDLFICK